MLTARSRTSDARIPTYIDRKEKTLSKRNNNTRRKMIIIISFYVLIILMSLLTVASYTWFSLSRTPRVSDMNMYINSQAGMELSADPLAEEWKLQLDFRDLVDVTTPLRPVTWSDKNQQFYAAAYGADGRQMPMDTWQPLTDERNANKDNLDGYYIKATFYVRSGVAVDVSLSPAVEVDEGINGSGTYVIGTPLWDSQSVLHNNGGLGAENAIRIGIRITPVDMTGAPKDGTSEFFIYEPNMDTHMDGTTDYIATPSIDGTEHLISEDHMIRQTASTWTEVYPVQRNVVIKALGEFKENPKLFTLNSGEMVMVDLYIWLEGQDVDCTNKINGAQILASIQFAGDAGSQSGMKPIE